MKSPIEQELRDAGIKTNSSGGVHQFRIDDNVSQRADRFAALQKLIVRTQAPQLACLTFLDLVDPKILQFLVGKTLIKHRIESLT
jgi:hypothetical protein